MAAADRPAKCTEDRRLRTFGQGDIVMRKMIGLSRRPQGNEVGAAVAVATLVGADLDSILKAASNLAVAAD